MGMTTPAKEGKITFRKSLKVIVKLSSLMALVLMAPLGAMGQATIFSDDFTSDASLASPPWYNLNNTVNAAATLNPVAGQGLALSVSSGTGRVNEEFARFSPFPFTLFDYTDYFTLIVDFNSSSFTGNSGGLLVGLYNTQGTVAGGTLTGTAMGGATADDTGYFGFMGFNTSPITSTKFFSRQGGAIAANELAYDPEMTAGSYTQVGGTFAASGNGTLANDTAYTLAYTVARGFDGNTITAVITQDAAIVDSWTVTDTNFLYNNFDELDFGMYGRSGPVDFNITDVSIQTNVGPIPEPSVSALAYFGFMGLVLVRRMRASRVSKKRDCSPHEK